MAFCGMNILFPSMFLTRHPVDDLLFAGVPNSATGHCSTSPNLRLMAVAGLLTGAAYAVKDPGVLLIPPVLLLYILDIPRRRVSLAEGVGILPRRSRGRLPAGE